MDWQTIIAFLAATMVLLVTPGPVMAIVMGNTLSGGQVTGFRTVLGVGLGEVALIGVLAISFLLSSRVFGDIFPWFSLASAAYLTWLAANTILRTTRPSAETMRRRSSRPVFDGLAITVSNPTALLFYSAFFVPFVRESESLPQQLAVFAALYVLLSLFFDLACVIFIDKLTRARRRNARFFLFARLSSVAVYVSMSILAVSSFLQTLNP
jgi:threonine/homoserine/homoserine lactone efflux protein